MSIAQTNQNNMSKLSPDEKIDLIVEKNYEKMIQELGLSIDNPANIKELLKKAEDGINKCMTDLTHTDDTVPINPDALNWLRTYQVAKKCIERYISENKISLES